MATHYSIQNKSKCSAPPVWVSRRYGYRLALINKTIISNLFELLADVNKISRRIKLMIITIVLNQIE